MQVLSICRWSALVAVAIAVSGCGEGEGPATAPVTGTVTHNRTPVEGAIVSFYPTGEGQNAVGTTDASGKYSLTTRKKDDGAIPGQYRVSITKYENAPASTGGSSAVSADGEMPADYTGEAPAAPPPKNLLPAKYASPDSSGFTATIGTGPNTHDFNLEG